MSKLLCVLPIIFISCVLCIDFITKQVENKLGMDLNGDGAVGSGTTLLMHR